MVLKASLPTSNLPAVSQSWGRKVSAYILSQDSDIRTLRTNLSGLNKSMIAITKQNTRLVKANKELRDRVYAIETVLNLPHPNDNPEALDTTLDSDRIELG